MDSVMVITNLALCAAGGFMIICRGRHMGTGRTKAYALWMYPLAILTFATSSLSWTFVGISEIQVVCALIIDICLLWSARDWKNGQPRYATRG